MFARSLHKQADAPKLSTFVMAEENGHKKRPRPQEHANKKLPHGFYDNFSEVSRIEEKDLMQPNPPLSFKDWPRCMQLGLIASLLPLMRSESNPEARIMIVRYREVSMISQPEQSSANWLCTRSGIRHECYMGWC